MIRIWVQQYPIRQRYYERFFREKRAGACSSDSPHEGHPATVGFCTDTGKQHRRDFNPLAD